MSGRKGKRRIMEGNGRLTDLHVQLLGRLNKMLGHESINFQAAELNTFSAASTRFLLK